MHNDSMFGNMDDFVYVNGKKSIGTLNVGMANISYGSGNRYAYEYEQARTSKRFGTYHPTSRQRELFAKKKKRSRHKKKR